MIETIAQPGPLTLARVQAEATAANGWLMIMSTEGRVFILAGDIVTCHADARRACGPALRADRHRRDWSRLRCPVSDVFPDRLAMQERGC
jgi:hypothetical protein